jgi:hypothetical protein
MIRSMEPVLRFGHRVAVLGTAWLLLSSPLAMAQPRQPPSELRVTVRDPSGAALITARVSLTDGSGRTQQATVDGRGFVAVTGLATGVAHLIVEATGFDAYDGPLTLKKGVNTVTVELPVAGLSEEVIVHEEPADRRGNSFTTILGEAEIADLPDDPDELEQMLMEMAGPDAVMRVNGFRGGRLPPKSQIRQIRFRRNSYAAENHHAGGVGIDVIIKPGLTGWQGMTSFAFRDESLNASNAFADSTGPEQHRRFGFNVDGPLAKGKTSFSFMTDGNLSYDSQTIVAATPSGLFSEQIRQPLDVVNATARVQHALTDQQTLLVEYQRRRDERRNLGVGDFDLPSRAYSRNRDDHRVRVALNGLLMPKIANELKVQFDADRESVMSASSDPAVVVVDAFASGGAGQQMDRRVRQFELEDNVDFAVGRKHAIRTGILLEGAWYRESQLRNGNGTFTFGSLEAFVSGRPNSWTQRVGGAPIEFAQYQLGAYVQDDITFSRELSISIGVRQELQNTLRDRANPAPRVGFTWSPSKWTFRGGWGIFNGWYDASLYEQTLLVNGVNQQDLIVLQPGYPDPFSSADATSLPPSIVRAAQELRMPYVSQASIGTERTFGSLRFQTSYTMQRGFNQPRSRNENAPVPGLGRPDLRVGNMTEIESSGRENVDRLHVGMNFVQPEKQLFINANYVLSRTWNHTDSALQLPADNDNLDAEWGPSSQDARHRLFAMASLGLPGQFRIMLMSQASSALPYTVITGRDSNGDGVTNDRPAGTRRNTGRGAASWNLNARLAKTFTFGPPRPTTPGTGPEGIRLRGGPPRGEGGGPRGEGIGPGGNMMVAFADPDAGRYRIEFYVQAYNILNRANYTRFSGNLQSPFFGTPTAAGPPRRLELGLMFGF